MRSTSEIRAPGPEPIGSEQYQQRCIDSIEPSVKSLIDGAAASGWDVQEALLAVMCIAALSVTDKTLSRMSASLDAAGSAAHSREEK